MQVLETALPSMRYRVEVTSKAGAQLAGLASPIAETVERKILWLAENSERLVHRRLVGMPDDLAGLSKLRVGDYRILYWLYHAEKLIRIYRIQHRSEVYRKL